MTTNIPQENLTYGTEPRTLEQQDGNEKGHQQDSVYGLMVSIHVVDRHGHGK